jgi:hypothetical protein
MIFSNYAPIKNFQQNYKNLASYQHLKSVQKIFLLHRKNCLYEISCVYRKQDFLMMVGLSPGIIIAQLLPRSQ